MSTVPASTAATGVCAQCGAPFRCGMAAGDAECWCAGLPRLLPVPTQPTTAEAGCFCPACLQARLDSARQERAPQ